MIGPQLGSTRRRGWRPSGKPARHAFAAHPGAAVDTTPKSVDHGSIGPLIFDQGQSGSCWGHGTSRALVQACRLAGKPLPFVPSQDDLYRLARALMRAHEPAGLGKLTDSGTDPVIGNQVFSIFGVKAMRVAVTSDGRYSDCEAATLNDEPVLEDIAADAHHIIVGDYGITSTGRQRVLDLRKALAVGPICLGFFCDMGFERWKRGDAPYGAPVNPNDPDGGGHWIVIDGYDTRQDGSTVFIPANSWSESWGDHGRCLVLEDFMLDPQVSDITAYVEVPS